MASPHFSTHSDQLRRQEFARNLGVDRKDFGAIEFLLRKGKRQLDAYSAPGIKDIH
jgi:succinate dehydrogenase assembly factor 1